MLHLPTILQEALCLMEIVYLFFHYNIRYNLSKLVINSAYHFKIRMYLMIEMHCKNYERITWQKRNIRYLNCGNHFTIIKCSDPYQKKEKNIKLYIPQSFPVWRMCHQTRKHILRKDSINWYNISKAILWHSVSYFIFLYTTLLSLSSLLHHKKCIYTNEKLFCSQII